MKPSKLGIFSVNEPYFSKKVFTFYVKPLMDGPFKVEPWTHAQFSP